MWFSKSKENEPIAPYPGSNRTLDGLDTAASVSSLCVDVLLLENELDHDTADQALSASSSMRESLSGDKIAGRSAGLAATGLRTAALVGQAETLIGKISGLAGKRLACVFHLAPRARDRQAMAVQGSHDACHSLADLGAFQLHAGNVQEVADLSLIAHRAAELTLTPGICVQDLYATGLSVQPVQFPDREMTETYLGRAGDQIETPFAAQRILFGPRRRRLPRLMDLDRPAGLGGYQDQESFPLAVAAQQPFFADHLEAGIQQAMNEFEMLTGRGYGSVSTHRVKDAEHVVVCMGAVEEQLRDVVDGLRSQSRARVGVIGLTVLRPFPGAQLTHLLKKKRIVSVLERSDAPLAEDPPLMRELRAAIDKASENGLVEQGRPHVDHASYQKPSHRPQLCSGTYGIGCGLPRAQQLAAVFDNMLSELPQRRFFLGVNFNQAEHRLPQLQVMQQELNQAYPDLAKLSLPDSNFVGEPSAARAMSLYSASGQRGLKAGNVIARALADTGDTQVRSEARVGTESALEVGNLTLVHGPETSGPWRTPIDTILVSGESLLDQVAGEKVQPGGRLVIASVLDGKTIWRGLSRRVENWIREQQLDVYVVDPTLIAGSSDTAEVSPPSWSDQWAVWALLGAGIHLSDAVLGESCEKQLGALLQGDLGAASAVADEILGCYRVGRQATAVDWQAFGSDSRSAQTELDAPWTVSMADDQTERLFDPGRFWHSVGFLHDSGQSEYALPDPMLATGMLPAASSAHRNLSPHRYRTPSWLAENCTGCGLCWTLCPDSALPATVQPLEQWLATAMEQCKAAGHALTQMNRITGHLVKMANQVLRKDDLQQHRSAGSLLETAFVQLMDKMGLEEEALSAMQVEFDQVKTQLSEWPFARTERYFDAANKAEPGSGALLTIPFNPSSCKGCGLCIEVCPEKAFDWRQYAPESEKIDRDNWKFRMQLPDSPETGQADRLLDREVYHTLVGGDSAAPALGSKIAVRLLTAALESVMKGRHQKHAEYLAQLIDRLRGKIQGEVAEAVQINDFDDFSQRLRQLENRTGVDGLVGLFGDQSSVDKLDQQRLQRLNDLLNRLEDQHRLYAEGRRSRQMLALHPELGLWSGYYPDNPHANPWMTSANQDTAALAEGLFDGMARVHAEEFASCRMAELELRDGFDPDRDSEALSWQQFTEDEMNVLPPVLMVAPASQTHWSDVSGLLAGRRPIRVALLDDSGPDGSRRDDHALQAMDQGKALVWQGSVGHPEHLLEAAVSALEWTRPSLFEVYAPDPGGCGIATEQVVQHARLAVESRVVPLFHYDPEAHELDLQANIEPQRDWTPHSLSVAEPFGATGSLETHLTVADWAIRQRRFRHHFQVMARGHLNREMKPLAEFLALSSEDREGFKPFINVTNEKRLHLIATLSSEMVALSENRLQRWRRLQSGVQRDRPVASKGPETDAVAVGSPQAVSAAPAIPSKDTHQALVEQLLQMCGYSAEGGMKDQSLRSFLDSSSQSKERSISE